jgi:predicted DNA-binding helix-hairpin-helix protein
MAYIHLKQSLSVEDKLRLMNEDARFDVADSEAPEGLETLPPNGTETRAGAADARARRIRETVKAPKAPRTAPKVFMSNDCAFNCSYCGCRRCLDSKARYASEPREFAQLALNAAAANGGRVFITSAIYKNPNYTEELIIETMRIMRDNLDYKGYLHAKIMPGCDPELIRQAGLYANRLSVNIEVAKSEGYKSIAREKNKTNILGPMGNISRLIGEAKKETGRFKPRFAGSQSTQLMAGSTGEDDFTILNLTHALYGKYNLSRVYYTPYQYHNYGNADDGRPEVETPKWRQTRLYQADRLMQLYGFKPAEIAPADAPNLTYDFDPKSAWALRNMHLFPIEINTADYEALIRIPGIGVTYAKRIIEARRGCRVTFDVLAQLGVSLKRSRHFMTADGKYDGIYSNDPDAYAALLRSPLDESGVDISC